MSPITPLVNPQLFEFAAGNGGPGVGTVIAYTVPATQMALLHTLAWTFNLDTADPTDRVAQLKWIDRSGATVYVMTQWQDLVTSSSPWSFTNALEGMIDQTVFPFNPPEHRFPTSRLPILTMPHGWSVQIVMNNITANDQIVNVSGTVLMDSPDLLSAEVPVYLVPEPAGVL
jgi:hypothetical protein